MAKFYVAVSMKVRVDNGYRCFESPTPVEYCENDEEIALSAEWLNA